MQDLVYPASIGGCCWATLCACLFMTPLESLGRLSEPVLRKVQHE